MVHETECASQNRKIIVFLIQELVLFRVRFHCMFQHPDAFVSGKLYLVSERQAVIVPHGVKDGFCDFCAGFVPCLLFSLLFGVLPENLPHFVHIDIIDIDCYHNVALCPFNPVKRHCVGNASVYEGTETVFYRTEQ